MIVLDLKATNLYSFNDFNINFTYPKKIVNSKIDDEFLSYCPSFRYKKFVLLMGANASGKTTLGKLLMCIMKFIENKEYNIITNIVNDNKKDAMFSIDFISDNKKFYRLVTKILAPKDNEYKSNNICSNVYETDIEKNDNYEKCIKRINESENDKNKLVNDINENYIKELEKIGKITWMYQFNTIDGEDKSKNKNSSVKYLSYLNKTLKILDPRIINVTKVMGSDDTYLINYKNRKVFVNELNDSYNIDKTISSGTKEGIDIARLFSSIKDNYYKFFYCDEKFSHVHSEVESSFISLMISCLAKDSQLIITSHNSDLLELNLPKHSFAFLKIDDDRKNIKIIYASDILKKNTDSIKCAVDNDVFGSSPNVNDIYKLRE